MFILKHHLKINKDALLRNSVLKPDKDLQSTPVKKVICFLNYPWISTSSEWTEARTEEKWNYLFYFFLRGCETLLMSKLSVFILSLRCLSEQSSINWLQITFSLLFLLMHRGHSVTGICDHGFHKSIFMMPLTCAFHCTIPEVSCQLHLNCGPDLAHLKHYLTWL